MGLDMYAVVVPVSDVIDDFSYEGESLPLTQWRKHHDLHGWMEALWLKKLAARKASAPVDAVADASRAVFDSFADAFKRLAAAEATPSKSEAGEFPSAVAYKVAVESGVPSEVPLGEALVEMPEKDRETIAAEIAAELARASQAVRAANSRRDFNQEKLRLTQEDLEQLRQDLINYKLPRTTGFFFGNFPPDENSNKDDLEFVDNALKLIENGFAVYYDSWW
jgi:hypothetical protein